MRTIMSKLILIPTLLALGVACLSLSIGTQAEEGTKDGDIEKLYKMVEQARADLEALRVKAGIPKESAEGRREGRGEHSEGRGREGRGEHGEGAREGRGERGEEGGVRLLKADKWNKTRNGAHLVLAYDAASQSFKGTVKNVTRKTLKAVRVEVHLSNRVELGPTKRTDLKPGATIKVELSAAGQKFTWWTTHPEHGSEAGHGKESGEGRGEKTEGRREGRGEHAEGGREGRGEHGEGSREGRGEHGEGSREGRGERSKRAENRPADPALRPLYNQLMLLRQEIKALNEGFAKQQR
jgi:hypothetical protein